MHLPLHALPSLFLPLSHFHILIHTCVQQGPGHGQLGEGDLPRQHQRHHRSGSKRPGGEKHLSTLVHGVRDTSPLVHGGERHFHPINVLPRLHTCAMQTWTPERIAALGLAISNTLKVWRRAGYGHGTGYVLRVEGRGESQGEALTRPRNCKTSPRGAWDYPHSLTVIAKSTSRFFHISSPPYTLTYHLITGLHHHCRQDHRGAAVFGYQAGGAGV